MSEEIVLPFSSVCSRNMEALSGFMKNVFERIDEAGDRLMKVFRAVSVVDENGREDADVNKNEIINLAKSETYMELAYRNSEISEEEFRRVFYDKRKRVLANLAMIDDIPLYKVLTENERQIVDAVFDKLLKLAEA